MTLIPIIFASVSSFFSPPLAGTAPSDIAQVKFLGAYSSGLFNESACEISAWSPDSKRLYVTNSAQGLSMVDISDQANPLRISMTRQFGITSVATYGNLVAMCWIPKSKEVQGEVRFFDLAMKQIGAIKVGFGPDMLTFTPDGKTLLVANEAEPSDDGAEDPAGSISVIDLSQGAEKATLRNASFDAFESRATELRAAGVHAPMPGRSFIQQLEPEYIAASEDGTRAFITLQEANALAVLDIAEAKIIAILPFGLKDFSAAGVGLDASDKENRTIISPWPIRGMYQPDTVAYFKCDGQEYLVTANEGESFEYPFYNETQRVSKLKNSKDKTKPALDPTRFPLSAEGEEGHSQSDLLKSDAIGRLEVSEACGDTDQDGDYDDLVCFGARSASIWRIVPATGDAQTRLELTWDSGSEMERTLRDRMPLAFNADNRENSSQDDRSDARGPEPEGVTVAMISDHRIIFVGLERAGGVMMWDATNPTKPIFAGYFNRRDTSIDLAVDVDGDKVPDKLADVGDLGPEGLLVIPASSSPTKRPILVVCNEVSGTLSLFDITVAEVADK